MVPTPRRAWTLGRLLSGKTISEAELVNLLGPFQAIGRRMAETPVEFRLTVWEAFLDGQDDRVEIILAIANAKPEGPPPEDDPDEDGDGSVPEWGPIRLGTLPPAEAFPLDVLPRPAQDLAEAAARSIGCPVDFPAVATLAAAAGLIGRSATILVKPGYFESSSLYLSLVGPPSMGKSPALRAALAPVREINRILHEEWMRELQAWNESPVEVRGEKPILRRIDTSDPTTEALGPILAANPRGMFLTPDEMTRWVMSMDQYEGGKGGDRPFYLSAWSGEPATIDRMRHANEPIVVPHPHLVIVGGMTPDMLSQLSEGRGREDGFSARLLFCYPDRVLRPYSEEGISEAVAGSWLDLALVLWRRQLRDLEGRQVPHIIRMTPEARDAWRDWCQAHRAEQEADGFPASLDGPWGKLEAYAARLALILHLMHLASDPTQPALDEPPELPRRIIDAAARVVAYFKNHAHRIRAAMAGKVDNGGDDVQALLGWIGRNGHKRFSTRDIGNDFDRFKHDAAALADALAWMTRNNLIRRTTEPRQDTSKPGRKRSPQYEVNPALWESPRFLQYLQKGPRARGSEGNGGNEGGAGVIG